MSIKAKFVSHQWGSFPNSSSSSQVAGSGDGTPRLGLRAQAQPLAPACPNATALQEAWPLSHRPLGGKIGLRRPKCAELIQPRPPCALEVHLAAWQRARRERPWSTVTQPRPIRVIMRGPLCRDCCLWGYLGDRSAVQGHSQALGQVPRHPCLLLPSGLNCVWLVLTPASYTSRPLSAT